MSKSKKTVENDEPSIRLYSIFDKKCGEYAMPFESVSDGTAIRTATAGAMDPKSSLHTFPEDFELHYLGLLGKMSGVLVSNPALIAQISTLKRKAS